jgi:AcrR family transcriptional regulator
MAIMDVREQILTSATRLFARRGYDGTSLSAIADEVGIRKPSLLYHFPSKEALREGVLDHVIQHWSEALPRLLSTVSSGRGRFEGLTRELLRFFDEDPDRATLVLRELMDRPDDMRARLSSGVRPWVELLADYVRQGQAAGGIHVDADPEAYVVHVITLALCGVAARGVLGTLMTGDDRERRHTRELLRIARTSLFDTDLERG